MSRREILFTQKLQRCVAVKIIALSLVAVNSSADCHESLVRQEANPETPMVSPEHCDSSKSINDLSEAEKVLDTPFMSPARRPNLPSDDEGCMPSGRLGLKLESAK
ncbi:MAG: hypothetical protein CBC09_07415 [Cellvibrionales bacterium TMED49]|nr:hypothetical protein [Porticoccaceae bacterium]OUU37067.1 MAG: hypothetical protein CBC09_07415 [Cellvibrionales bacterium TMED49]|tara:strand:- start:1089 stop:1406 length:318 start_codon:yes stop_codon:yes gene_type:complete